jgi:hypothetical protein
MTDPLTGARVHATEESFKQLTPRQQAAVIRASREAVGVFNRRVRLYALPAWVSIPLVTLRGIGWMFLPFAILTWATTIIGLKDTPWVQAAWFILTAAWRH